MWEVRDSPSDTSWEILQNSRKLNYLEFTPDIFDHKKQYRCVVYNNAGYSATSNIATLTISPTYKIVNNTSSSEIFSRNDNESIYLYMDVVSTYTSAPLYQWQKYSGSWVNIQGENQKSLKLDVASLPESSAYRCRVSLGVGGTVFGNECLVEENTLLNLYKGRCDDLLTTIQEDAVDDIIANPLIINTDCAKGVVNTCGMSIEELLDTYEFYDYQKGLFKSWGEVDFPWKISEASSNLIYSETDDKWGVSAYKGIIVYPTGSRVLLVEEDGYIISLYEAKDNVLSISGAFDYSKWKKICEVRTSIPAGLPSPGEILERFEEYKLDRFVTSWGEMTLKFSENAYEKTLSDCLNDDLNLVDFQKCINSNSSDQWNNVRNKKDFFYRKGDRFYVQGECGDTLCIYFVKNDIPVTEEFYSEFKVFKESQFWEKIYCVSTGRNKCLEYTRRKEPELGYDVIELGSNNHFVEMPVPYRLKPPQKTLDSMAEIKQNPIILSQEEIDNLNQP